MKGTSAVDETAVFILAVNGTDAYVVLYKWSYFKCLNAPSVLLRRMADEPPTVVRDLTDMPVWSELRAWLC